MGLKTKAGFVACHLILAAGALAAQQGAAGLQPAVKSGDVARGKLIFEGKGACLTCHRLKDNGSRLGPDLTNFGIVTRSREEVERSLFEPDAEILPHNRFYRVVTADGATITGRLLDHDTFSVRLIDSYAQLLTFQKSKLREYGFLKNSPMASYRDKLTAQELSDLIAYLASLKGITRQ